MTDHLSLKEAYNIRKELEAAKAFQETVEFLENHYLIAEKLDTATISRIVDSMNGVEQALSSVLDKLPSLKTGLDAAEAELTNLVSGKSGNDPKKTGAMLGKAMAFYQHLSSFLKQDLPVLLKSRIMAQARTNPDQPVGSKIAPAFQQALEVEKTGGFLKRLFGSTNIPYINNGSFAKELTTLSFKELESLTKVGQTPAVMPQAQINQLAAQVVGQPSPSSQQLQVPLKPIKGNIEPLLRKIGGAQGLINFITRNHLENQDNRTVASALNAVLQAPDVR
jgi:hypothetical protein